MRKVMHAATSLLTLATCFPGFADPAAGQQPPSEPPFTASALDGSALDLYRAGADLGNRIRPEGLVAGNSASDLVSGMNSISGGAFTNASGLPIVIQNTGANVLIQNATIIHIELQ